MARSVAVVCAVGLCSLAFAAPASAVPLFAAPADQGTADCLSAANACDLQQAMVTASTNDDVTLLSGLGNYVETTTVTIGGGANGLTVHGQAGQPRPRIVTTAIVGVEMNSFDGVLRRVEIQHSGTGPGLRVVDGDATPTAVADQVVASTSNGTAACELNIAGTLRDTVCSNTAAAANSYGVAISVPGGTYAFTLRNVTAVGNNGPDIRLVAIGAGSTATVTATNVIASIVEAATTDITAIATINLDHSNFGTENEIGAGMESITDPGTGTGNQDANVQPPLLSADLHQLSGSPTINAGTGSAGLGTADIDGDARTIGAAPDIGADEFVPAAPSGPSAPSNAFSVGGVSGKNLKITVGSAGTASVDDAGANPSGTSAAAAASNLLKPSTATGGPGEITIPLKLTKKAKGKLREKGKVKISAQINFTPAGGTANTQTQKLTIKK